MTTLADADALRVLIQPPSELRATLVSPSALRAVIASPSALRGTVAVGQGPAGPRGLRGPSGADGDKSYRHAQSVAAAVWTIAHGLGKYPSVTVLDSAGDQCEGDLSYVDTDSLTLTFQAGFAGAAFLN